MITLNKVCKELGLEPKVVWSADELERISKKCFENFLRDHKEEIERQGGGGIDGKDWFLLEMWQTN